MSKEIKEYVIKCPRCNQLNSTFSEDMKACESCGMIIDIAALNAMIEKGLTDNKQEKTMDKQSDQEITNEFYENFKEDFLTINISNNILQKFKKKSELNQGVLLALNDIIESGNSIRKELISRMKDE